MNKKQMIKFLSEHFRYDTMSSWNQSTSYAVNVKVHNLPNNYNAYEMLEQEEAFYEINELIEEFAERYNHCRQIGFNGRSSGYMVMYKGGTRDSEHKSRCSKCGQLNFTSVKKTGKICGRCGAKTRYDVNFKTTYSLPGQSIGSRHPEEYEDMEMDELREDVKLVKDFDKTVAKCVKSFTAFCKENKVVDEEIQVSKTVKVVQPK